MDFYSTWIFAWLVPILVGIGLGVLQMNDFKLAKACFLFSAIVAWLQMLMWGLVTSNNVGLRLLICFTTSGLIGVLLVESFRYVNKKQDTQLAAQSNPEPNKEPTIETQPSSTPAITSTAAASPSASPTLKKPTFTEGVDAVMFTVGPNSHLEEAVNLENGKRPFFIGDVPATLYFEDGKPFIDVDLYAPPNEPPVRLRHNELKNKPSQWEMNFDDDAIEVVDEKERPIFQLYYKSPSHIVMYGVFFNGYVNWLASPERYASTPNLDKKPYPLKRLFKYPSSKYLHRRAGQSR